MLKYKRHYDVIMNDASETINAQLPPLLTNHCFEGNIEQGAEVGPTVGNMEQ